MSQTKRIFYFDVLRALAIVGIVFCHVSTFFVLMDINTPYFAGAVFYNCFRDFSIPVFVMLSGALLLNKADSLTNFFKRRLSRILIPFIFWVAVYSIYSFVYVSNAVDFNDAFNIFIGKPGTLGVTFWYVWMIIVAYVGIFVINRIISVGNKKMADFDKKFITFLTVMSVMFIAARYFGLFDQFDSMLFYFVSFLSYIIIGYYIANNDLIGNRIGKNAMIFSTLMLSICLYALYIFNYVVPTSIANNHFTYLGYFNPLIVIISVNVFLLFKYLSRTGFFIKMEKESAGDVINVISRYSFGIYLAHFLVLKKLIGTFGFLTSQNPLFSIPILVIVTIIVCYVILWILSKIPYVNRVSGVY